MDYYSEGKKNQYTLKFVCKWMELEKKNILSEVIQTQKVESGIYSLISGY